MLCWLCVIDSIFPFAAHSPLRESSLCCLGPLAIADYDEAELYETENNDKVEFMVRFNVPASLV